MPPGESEVDDPDGGIGVGGSEQYVLRLEVPVHDPAIVHVGYGLENLAHESRGLALLEARRAGPVDCRGFVYSFDDPIVQLAPPAQIGDDVKFLLVLVHVHEVDYVGMIHLLQQRRFACEIASLDGGIALENGLDGESLAGDVIDAFSHESVHAGAEDAVVDDAVLVFVTLLMPLSPTPYEIKLDTLY